MSRLWPRNRFISSRSSLSRSISSATTGLGMGSARVEVGARRAKVAAPGRPGPRWGPRILPCAPLARQAAPASLPGRGRLRRLLGVLHDRVGLLLERREILLRAVEH